MYPYATTPGETSKRNLSPTTSHGVCDVYQPLAGKLGCYSRDQGGYGSGCSAAPLRASGLPLAAARGAGSPSCASCALRRRRR